MEETQKTTEQIRFEPMCLKRENPTRYNIISGDSKIGEIYFKQKGNIFVIGYIKILEYHQKKHYGYKVIDYILSHYKIDCIVGESLYEARGFWNKCIKKYKGKRKNISLSMNCTSSFIIPEYDIGKDEMVELLNIGCEIV